MNFITLTRRINGNDTNVSINVDRILYIQYFTIFMENDEEIELTDESLKQLKNYLSLRQ